MNWLSNLIAFFSNLFSSKPAPAPKVELPAPSQPAPAEPVKPVPASPVVAPDTGRVLETELREFVDSKRKALGLPDSSDPTTLMLQAARALEGIHEEGGNNKGKYVKLIQETVGSASAEAWCMSTVQSCIRYAELKTGKASPLKASEHCLTVYNAAPSASKHSSPAVGRIVIYRHGSSDSGHTAMIQKIVDSSQFKTTEGNTGPESAVNRDGDGVYPKTRSVNGSGDMKIVGYLDAF